MNAKEYNDCVTEWADRLYRFVIKSCGNAEDARDIVQGSFEVLWKNREQVEAPKAKSYLFTVAYNQTIDRHRKSGRVVYPEHPPDMVQQGTRQQTDLKKILDRALQQLDERSRQVILLKDYEGYSYEEIVHLAQLSLPQVKIILHRARKTLKEYLVSIEKII
jgi:RNA polymerase sigma-70 factor (ECF subfamily)